MNKIMLFGFCIICLKIEDNTMYLGQSENKAVFLFFSNKGGSYTDKN